MPEISVVMPVYNEEKYIGEAIDSILAQTYTDFEFIIIDDGSTDGSADIVRSYNDKRIIFVQNEKNLGITKTLNRGLDLARGKYIARMDADDISYPDRFAEQIKYMESHPDIAALGTDIEGFGQNHVKYIFEKGPEKAKTNMLFNCSMSHPSMMMRASVFGAGGLRYDENYNGAEDYEMWVRASHEHKLDVLGKILLRYRFHEKQVTQRSVKKCVEKARQIKARQMRELGLPCDSAGFEIFLRYCDGYKNMTEDEAVTLVCFLDDIKKANDKAGIYDIKFLSGAVFGHQTAALKKFDLKTAVGIFRKSGKKPYKYVYRRLGSWAKAKLRNYLMTRKSRRGLKNRNFTIISNNCWSGEIYEKYGMRKDSPTCGLFFSGGDYVKFCENIRHYINQKPVFIPMEKAKLGKAYGDSPFPVALLDDIEVYFMHYKTEEIAADKWIRRCRRIHFDNIIYKFSEREEVTPDDIRRFAALPLEHKLIFASQKYTDDTIVIEDINLLTGQEAGVISDHFDEKKYLNSIKTSKRGKERTK